MGGFTEAARKRVHDARAAVAAAREAGDAYEAAVAQDELDDALRVARRHGVDVGDDTAAEADEG
ncbi:hypothetical protein LK07_16085 [Streptomyces pluripotens]|uniref:Uncharacterized protein n=1 Tax=Streptomyces pluripotens TaxID=1355015 RepID=A0A221NZ42_9ACTN|nr:MULTISPECIES: hypothetical protein [Streptomyces]ARP71041.1 hypothetical protein LK06_014950 [Streptomyces pluripotens]ASN25293.1 hypothetical protein LK07_16085 [Streptomyces pluripotens]KIE25929.1 hypothetical protein LK08_15980 [Streptomyces sp. MUSC 125]MCH0557190.1 hypothetical protein [Streptomyces sp. MUM 16J]